jgi:hypothetical protein
LGRGWKMELIGAVGWVLGHIWAWRCEWDALGLRKMI